MKQSQARNTTLYTGIVKALRTSALAATFALSVSTTALAQADDRAKFDIPEQPLPAALKAFAEQADMQLLYRPESINGATVQALRGEFDKRQALQHLLEGTDLEVVYSADNAATIRPRGKEPATKEANTSATTTATSLTPRDSNVDAANTSVGERQLAPKSGDQAKDLEKIVVTGTRIRGASPAAPVLVVSRDDLDRSGHGTVAAALAALPQNFSGSVNDGLNHNGGERQGTNAHFGSGLNLRGLGSDATLVLVNGRRMGGAGSNAEFSDISTIPTAAVERVELLLDGASALYGSDAVGGVVNIILRDSFEGAETRLRGGVATAGEPFEGLFAQTFGWGWNGGSALVSYEHHRRDRLRSEDREISRDADLRRLGGRDHRTTFAFPGNILRIDPATGTNAPYWAIPAGQDGNDLQPEDFIGGSVNLRNQREGVDALPRQVRHSAYLTARHEWSDRIEISGDLRYGYRKYDATSSHNTGLISVNQTNPYFVSPSGATSHSIQYAFVELPNAIAAGSSESIGISLGLDARLWGGWRGDAYVAFARETGRSDNTGLLNTIAVTEALGLTPDRSDTPFNPAVDGYFNPFAGQAANHQAVLDYIGGGYQRIQNRGEVRSLNIKADGSLFALPAGAIKLAVGLQHREEEFTRGGENYTTSVDPIPLASVDVGRKIDAAFAELRLPLFDRQNRRLGLERLELSLAARIERYDDFGWTNNPKVGVIWSPVSGLLFRASYGQSFRAPALRELSDPPSNSSSLLPSGTTRVGALIQSGGNPDLDPETADSITAGFEFAPAALDGFRFGASWFDIRFKDRIDRPVQSSIQTALDDPNVSTFVRRISPAINQDDYALIAALLADPATRTVLGPPEAYGAIVDSRYVNTASLRVSGVDLSVTYEHEFGGDSLAFGANVTHLYRYDQQLTPTSSGIDLLGVATYPLDWRARATVDWWRGDLGGGVALNYASSYEDALGAQIGSLTTLDLQLRVFPSAVPWLRGTSFVLGIRNLLDDDPPFYDSSAGVAYDPANGDPIGRFLWLQLSKDW